MTTLEFEIATASAMEQIAIGFAQGLRESGERIIVTLQGPLGAGKTTWCRGLLRALGYLGVVKSPTYTLVESYPINQTGSIDVVHHFDLYRLADPEELEYIGGRDYFDGQSVCLIEWPEQGKGALPPEDIAIKIAFTADGVGRRVAFRAATRAGEQVLDLMSG